MKVTDRIAAETICQSSNVHLRSAAISHSRLQAHEKEKAQKGQNISRLPCALAPVLVSVKNSGYMSEDRINCQQREMIQ